MCIETSAFSILDSSAGTLWPDIGAANETPESFFAFQTRELNSINESVILVNSQVSKIGFSGKVSTSTADLPYNVVDKWCVKNGQIGDIIDIMSLNMR